MNLIKILRMHHKFGFFAFFLLAERNLGEICFKITEHHHRTLRTLCNQVYGPKVRASADFVAWLQSDRRKSMR